MCASHVDCREPCHPGIGRKCRGARALACVQTQIQPQLAAHPLPFVSKQMIIVHVEELMKVNAYLKNIFRAP